MPTRTDATSPESFTESFTADWEQWHAAHERRRAHPHGFLAVTHLHWLSGTAARLDGVPGTWSVQGDSVRIVLEPGESLQRDGQELNTGTGTATFLEPIEERGGIDLVAGESVIEVAKRGGEYIVRPRDPQAALLREYRGTPTYAPNPEFSVVATFAPFPEPRSTTVGAAVEGIQHVYEAPGEFRFELAGRSLALTAFNGSEPGSYLVLFTDRTSGVTTYPANRAVPVVPAADGSAQLDFNRAVNLPCAYTDLATCPLPPAENRLPVAIEAGEKIPYEREGQQ